MNARRTSPGGAGGELVDTCAVHAKTEGMVGTPAKKEDAAVKNQALYRLSSFVFRRHAAIAFPLSGRVNLSELAVTLPSSLYAEFSFSFFRSPRVISVYLQLP